MKSLHEGKQASPQKAFMWIFIISILVGLPDVIMCYFYPTSEVTGWLASPLYAVSVIAEFFLFHLAVLVYDRGRKEIGHSRMGFFNLMLCLTFLSILLTISSLPYWFGYRSGYRLGFQSGRCDPAAPCVVHSEVP